MREGYVVGRITSLSWEQDMINAGARLVTKDYVKKWFASLSAKDRKKVLAELVLLAMDKGKVGEGRGSKKRPK